jgi:hypothetical protein
VAAPPPFVLLLLGVPCISRPSPPLTEGVGTCHVHFLINHINESIPVTKELHIKCPLHKQTSCSFQNTIRERTSFPPAPLFRQARASAYDVVPVNRSRKKDPPRNGTESQERLRQFSSERFIGKSSIIVTKSDNSLETLSTSKIRQRFEIIDQAGKIMGRLYCV